MEAALRDHTLYAWARRQPGAHGFRGRAPAWATRLADGTEIVVRHARHGGLLAPLTRDLFLRPTRAPHELRVALRLADAGIPTPRIEGYALYPAFGPFVRADIVTARVNGLPFPEAWEQAADDTARDAIISVVARLLLLMRDARVLHPDLNARNILIAEGQPAAAVVLDVDRVEFDRASPGMVGDANASRLMQSLLGNRLRLAPALSAAQCVTLLSTAGGRR